MLSVGLTGSIAVGKSYVSTVLAELGCHVLDSDKIARDLVAPETPGLLALVETFGADILLADGTLDRAKLGALVFADPEKRLLLNSLLHPLVFSAQDEALRRWEGADPTGIGIIDAALMIESGGFERFDRLIVVHCHTELQFDRLMRRNNLQREEAERRISAQMSQEEKLLYADYRIDTSEGFDNTRQQTREVYGALRLLADGMQAAKRAVDEMLRGE